MAEFQYTAKQIEALRLISGGAHHIMFYGGSRSGKTFGILCAVIIRALKAPGSRHAVIKRTYKSVRQSIGMDTFPKALKLRFPGLAYEHNRSDGFFRLPNGSEIWLIGLDDAERADKVLGKEFCTLYFSECSELDYSSIETALSRNAQNCPEIENKVIYDCNPPGKSHWTYRVFIQKLTPGDRTALKHPEDYASMIINPIDNIENLPPGYIENTLANMSKRKRERFLEGKFLDDMEGALWTGDMISRHRVVNPPELARIVIGVDPAVTSGEESDYTGIVAAGIGEDGDFYVLEDASCQEAPLDWCRAVVDLYYKYDADRVIGEVNNGGDLIESLMRTVDRDISYRSVRATHGKITRAEPIAALYEQGRVHHVGMFNDLEDEMTSYAPLTAVKSPDRMDALVWALTELKRDGQRFILA